MGDQSIEFGEFQTYGYESDRDLFHYVKGFSVLLLGVVIGAMMFGDGYGTNIYTELLSVIATIAILDRRSERRDYRRQERDMKARLIRQVASSDNATVLKALREIEDRNWLDGENGILQGAYLKHADLSGANLMRANLRGAYLMSANLSDVNLWDANLSGAELVEANLSCANLINANLSGANLQVANLDGADLGIAQLECANLQVANLENADLRYANLGGANLQFSNLTGTVLEGANLKGTCLNGARMQHAIVCNKTSRLSHETTLPTNRNWSPDTDMSQFGCFVDMMDYIKWRESQQESDT